MKPISRDFIIEFLQNNKPISQGSNGKIYDFPFKNKRIILKLVPLKVLHYEYKQLNVYNNLTIYCKRHIPKYIDIGVNKIKFRNRYYGIFCMEKIKGITYSQFLQNTTDCKIISKTYKRLQKAIMCLWKAGYIHGDFHLDNVMITNKLQIKIIDFEFTEHVKPLRNDINYESWFKSQWNINLKFPNLAIYKLDSMPTNALSYNDKHKIYSCIHFPR